MKVIIETNIDRLPDLTGIDHTMEVDGDVVTIEYVTDDLPNLSELHEITNKLHDRLINSSEVIKDKFNDLMDEIIKEYEG